MELEWNENLATGNKQIDDEHKALIKAIDSLLTACRNGHGKDSLKEVAVFLSDYVKTHFSHEEELQRKHNYPKYEPHKKFHDQYSANMTDLCNHIVKEGANLSMVVKVNVEASKLITHIRTEDAALARHIRGE